MPGNGTYANGKTYTGHHRPTSRLTAEATSKATTEQLRAWWNALNDAFDFDAVDGLAYHNMDLVNAELTKRGWK